MQETAMSIKHIILTTLMFVMIPILARIIDIFVVQETISLMISMNLLGTAIIIYNWQLLELHYQRIKGKSDLLFYLIVDIAAIALIFYLGNRFFKADILIASKEALKAYGHSRIGMVFAFSYIEAAIVNITFKCITDHLNIKQKELQVVLTTAISFGFLFTFIFVPLDLSLLIRTYVYNLFLISILSYSYNQTHSILPGIFSMGLIYLIVLLLRVYL